ncbi:MAG TPA: O-antigen ligase family protein [Actinomycetota bacterium]
MSELAEHVALPRPEAAAGDLHALAPHDAGVPRPAALEAGLAVLFVFVPLAFLPFTWAPFADVKLLLVAVAALLIWRSGVALDRSLALPATAWVAALSFASIVGVDPWNSLFGPTDVLTGFLLLSLCAFLLVAGAAVPSALAARIPGWLASTGLAVSAIVLSYRFAPGLWSHVIANADLSGGTVGSVVYASGFVGVAVVAAASRPGWSLRRVVLTLIVLGSALTVLAERAGWVAAAVGLVLALWRGRASRRHVAAVCLTLIAVLAAWTVLDAVLPGSSPVSVVQRSQLAGSSDLVWRIGVVKAVVVSWTHRPLLGWGPGNTWSAFLASAPASLLRVAGRTWKDAHDLFAESLGTSGIVGLAALLWLLVTAGRRAVRAPKGTAWALGAAAALLAFHLLQPMNVTLTPLLFLSIGIAAGGARTEATPMRHPTPPDGAPRRFAFGHAALGIALVAAVVGGLCVVTASSLERYGRTYGSEAALRTAARIEPGRLSATEALALDLGLDGRGGDPAAAVEARSMIGDAVTQHPWDPGVRLAAFGVEQLLSDPAGARAWIRQQAERFPGDVATLSVTTKGQRPIVTGAGDG